MLEVILTIILCPILEIIGTIIYDKFANKIKNPFEKHYKESLSKNNKTFSMIREPENTAVLWVGIVGFSFLLIVGIIPIIILTHTKEIKVIEAIIIVIIYMALFLPFISIFLHYATKKIYVTEEQIFINSIFLKKKYYIKEITKAKETKKIINTIETNHTLEISFQDKIIKIPKYYSNYELLKNILIIHKN